ncbi:MAG: Helix-turn-helix domain [Mycobacteriales bacterium]|jgi:transcriptional regulator with XRE-family HTH domain
MVNDSINDIDVFLRLVGQRVAAARQLRRLSQEQLAERSGLPVAVLGALERGDSGVEVDDLQRVADVLGTAITDLLPSEAEVRATAGAARAGGPPSRQDPAGGRPVGS